MPFDPKAVSAHPAHELIRSTLEHIRELQAKGGLPDPQTVTLVRISTVLEDIQARLTAMNPMLISVTFLSTLHALLERVHGQITQFYTTQNAAHLEEANQVVDQNILPQLPLLPLEFELPSGKSAAASLADYHAATVASISKLEQQLSAHLSKAGDLDESIKEMNSRLEKARSDIDQTVSAFHQKYGEFQSIIRNEFDEKQKEMRAEFETDKKAFDSDRTSSTKNQETKSLKLIQSLERMNAEAEKLVESIGTTGLTGNYKRIAEAERSTANIMRFLSVVCMLGGLAVIAHALSLHQDYNVTSTLLRVVLGIAFTGPALYLAHESSKHRNNEVRARKVELELASLGPFIIKMPEDKQIAVRDKLVDRFFGIPLTESPIELPPNLITALLDTLKTFKP